MRRAVPLLLLALAACEDEPTATDLTLCQGAGDPGVQVGEGSLTGFSAWSDGDRVTVDEDGGGSWGFQLSILTEGLDTTASVTTLVRYTIGGGGGTTEDVAATLTLQCPNEGPGWAGVRVPLDDSLQSAAAVAGLDGAALDLSVTVSDQAGEAGDRDLALVVDSAR